MFDITPILALLALIAGPILAARLVTGGEPVDLPGVVTTVTGSPGGEDPPPEGRRWGSPATCGSP